MRSVQRTGQAAQGGAGFDGGGVFLRQAQVFEHQVGAKATGVALAGRGSFVHARVGVVLFQGPVAPRAAAHDFGQHFGIEAVGHAQGHGFAGADHQDAQQHVVADFGGLARADIARMEDVGPHFFQHRAGAFQLRCAGTDHKGQRTGHGTAHATRDGGINKVNAGGLRSLRHLLAGGGGDGGAVNHQRAFGHAGQQANLPFAAQVQAFNVLAGGQHADDDFCALHRVLGADGRLAACRNHAGDGGGAEVKHFDVVAGFDQVDGHGAAHVAQADKSDLHGVSPVGG